LLTLGVIIQGDDELEDLYVDRSKIDYDKFYNEVNEAMPELALFVEYIRNTVPPQPHEWQKLIPQAQNGNKYAKTRLIEMYLRLVLRTAWYYSNKYHFSFEDALQDGLVGAITALDKYNLSDHTNYATYFPLWVTQHINRNALLPNIPAYFPVHIKEKLFSIMNEVEEHICASCPDKDGAICYQLIKSISDKHEWSSEESLRNIQYVLCWTSLDQLADDEDAFGDEGAFAEAINKVVDDAYNNRTLKSLLGILNPREKEVILLRYGFTQNGVLTLEATGQILGVTRERIRQIEAKAIRKLSHPSRKKLLDENSG
jgi:RNA polymerase primary sigma factor